MERGESPSLGVECWSLGIRGHLRRRRPLSRITGDWGPQMTMKMAFIHFRGGWGTPSRGLTWTWLPSLVGQFILDRMIRITQGDTGHRRSVSSALVTHYIVT